MHNGRCGVKKISSTNSFGRKDIAGGASFWVVPRAPKINEGGAKALSAA